MLSVAQSRTFIPYENALGEYVSSSDARARYENLSDFYSSYGHFWIGTNVFFLENGPSGGFAAALRRFDAYPEPADRWSAYALP